MRSRRIRVVAGGVLAVALAVFTARFVLRPGGRPADVPVVPTDGLSEPVASALARAREAVVRNLRSSDAWGHYGEQLMVHEFHDAAILCFGRAEELGTDWRWPYLRGVVLHDRRPTEAVEPLELAAARVGGASDEPALQLALTLLVLGRADEAEDALRTLLVAFPAHPEARLRLARILAESDRFVECEELLGPSTSDPRTRRPALALLARVRASQQKDGTARELLEEVRQLPRAAPWPRPVLESLRGESRASATAGPVSRDIPGRMAIVRVLVAGGRFEEAERELQGVLKTEPSYAPAIYQTALCQLALDRPEEALDSLTLAVAYAPLAAEIHRRRGEVLAEQGHVAEARRSFERVLRLRPGDGRATERIEALRARGPE